MLHFFSRSGVNSLGARLMKCSLNTRPFENTVLLKVFRLKKTKLYRIFASIMLWTLPRYFEKYKFQNLESFSGGAPSLPQPTGEKCLK